MTSGLSTGARGRVPALFLQLRARFRGHKQWSAFVALATMIGLAAWISRPGPWTDPVQQNVARALERALPGHAYRLAFRRQASSLTVVVGLYRPDEGSAPALERMLGVLVGPGGRVEVVRLGMSPPVSWMTLAGVALILGASFTVCQRRDWLRRPARVPKNEEGPPRLELSGGPRGLQALTLVTQRLRGYRL